MRILLISYGDYEYDGRLRALIKVFRQMGELKCFLGGGGNQPWITVYKSPYPLFLIKSIQYAIKSRNFDVLVLDNRKATVSGLVIKRLLKPKVVVQDCREFYKLKEVKHLSGKIGCIFEQKMIKKADIIIAANKERSNLMVKEYGLKDAPLTYENLRQLEYESEEIKKRAEEKMDRLVEPGWVNIISSSGCDISRTNDVLVRNLKNVNKRVKLYLVGDSNEKDVSTIKTLAKKDFVNSVVITGRLNQSELKYLISRCDIGIVNYGQYDTNNKYCASGKLFEFIYEGIPVVTTTNPPLKNTCEDYSVGIADDDYHNGINIILSNYDYYKSNVLKFADEHSVEANDKQLVENLNGRMGGLMK